jgi:hypothetical protein
MDAHQFNQEVHSFTDDIVVFSEFKGKTLGEGGFTKKDVMKHLCGDIEDKNMDDKCYEMFKIMKKVGDGILLELLKDPEGIKGMCTSTNNSIPIADYMEQLAADIITRILLQEKKSYEIYKSGQEGRTDHDKLILDSQGKPYVRIAFDNKGVRVKKYWKNYLIKELQVKLDELEDVPSFSGKKQWHLMIEHIEKHNLLNNGIPGRIYKGKIQYDTDLYSECDRDNDHPDQNFHMKCSQSNLKGFTSTIEGGSVTYNGLIPQDIDIPHFTFIIKHIFSEEHGIHKLVLISVPHCSIQMKYYEDIQLNGEKTRMAKAKDEFRFNMNDKDGNPYKFIGSDISRYHVFNILHNLKYCV